MLSPLLIFMHIPRTGGRSVGEVLSHVYGDASVWIHAPILRDAVRFYNKREPVKQQELRALWGHMPFGIHDGIDRECRYVTVLRDPVDNLYSLYNYSRQTADHYLQPIASLPFEHWVEQAMSAWDADNPQTRYLAGLNWIGWQRKKQLGQLITTEHLEKAVMRLKTRIEVVGTTDDIPSFIERCAEAFRWETCPKTPEIGAHDGVVQSKKPSRREVFPAKLVDRIDELLHHDVAMYRCALEMASGS